MPNHMIACNSSLSSHIELKEGRCMGREEKIIYLFIYLFKDLYKAVPEKKQ